MTSTIGKDQAPISQRVSPSPWAFARCGVLGTVWIGDTVAYLKTKELFHTLHNTQQQAKAYGLGETLFDMQAEALLETRRSNG